ncbi:hypothetical protein ST47_g1578 [Ascochyta rabiei]|uniref:Uncharacterized protein n=1 Tax=Didymella rabiei TaxID=5454 RepID=A0A163KUW7_DIDRA|nr:hypothetical protein ST47_g1578 [Ascochyta rabiei]
MQGDRQKETRRETRYTLHRMLVPGNRCRSENNKGDQLGQIKVVIMSRATFDMNTDAWKKVYVTGGAPGGANDNLRFIDVASLLHPKARVNNTLHLGTLGSL